MNVISRCASIHTTIYECSQSSLPYHVKYSGRIEPRISREIQIISHHLCAHVLFYFEFIVNIVSICTDFLQNMNSFCCSTERMYELAVCTWTHTKSH